MNRKRPIIAKTLLGLLITLLFLSASISINAQTTDQKLEDLKSRVKSSLEEFTSLVNRPTDEDFTISIKQERIRAAREDLIELIKTSQPYQEEAIKTVSGLVKDYITGGKDPQVAIQYCILLKEIGSSLLVENYIDMLASDDNAVKLIGIASLDKVIKEVPKDKINEIEEKLKETIIANRDKTVSGYAAKLLSKLDTPSSHRLILDILQGHRKIYAEGKFTTAYPDRFLIEKIGSIYRDLKPQDQKNIKTILVGILKDATSIITNKSRPITIYELQADIKLVVYQTEKTLADITGENKDLPLTEALKRNSTEQALKAAEKWEDIIKASPVSQ